MRIGHEPWFNLVGLGLSDLVEEIRIEQLARLDQPLVVNNLEPVHFARNRICVARGDSATASEAACDQKFDASAGSVIGLLKCDLASAEVITWCTAMRDADRGGFIVKEHLESLRNHFQTRSAD